MESTNNNNNNQLLFLSEFKELRNELSAVKKRIVQLEKSQEKQQIRIDGLEIENHVLKTELNNLNNNKEGGSVLTRKRSDQDQEEEIESKSTSDSSGKKKAKIDNNDDDEAVVISQRDNGDSFDSLSDDLLHKIVEFNGNCYSQFGSINKTCKNIYDVKEYKLTKETSVYGYGTVDMMLELYLQKRREGKLNDSAKINIAAEVVSFNRLDVIDWIIQLEDIKLLQWLRKYGAKWSAIAFYAAIENGHDEIEQYLRAEGCPQRCDEDLDESSGSEQLGSDGEDGDY